MDMGARAVDRLLITLLALVLWWPLAAFGAIATTTISVNGTTVLRAQMLTSAVATTDGEWIDASGLKTMSVHVAGITTATVEIDGSNATTKPADNTHGIKLNATDITTDQVVMMTINVRWVKVRITAYTSGTINAYLEGHGGSR
jgi:hypothetical protein